MAKYQLSKEEIKQLQRLIGAEEDGLWGPKSKAALNEFTLSQFEPMTEPSTAEYNPLFNTGRVAPKIDKPEPVADYREDKYRKEPINYMDALLALKNLESNKPMPRVPSSWVGWASYINSGDRGLLSEFAEADKAWNMKKLEEEEKARQLISNIREKDLDRKNAREIAEMNHVYSGLDKMDELMKLRNRAAINVEYAQQVLNSANAKGNKDEISKAERELEYANEELAYYNNRTGYNGVSKQSNEDPQDKSNDSKEPLEDINVIIERLNSITPKNKLSEMESALKEAESHPMKGQDKNLESLINKLKGLIKDKKAWEADEAFMRNWKYGQPFDSNKFRRFISKGVWQLIRKNRGE